MARWPRVWVKPGRRPPQMDRLTSCLVLALAVPPAMFWMFLPLSEIAAGALVLFAALLGTQAGHDLKRGLLPLPESVLIVALGLVSLTLGTGNALDALLGSLTGVGLFYALNLIWLRRRGQLGFGGGDIRLMAGLGLWVGLSGLAYLILVAAVGGLLMARLTRAGDSIAFGPWLALSGWIIVLLKVLDMV